MKRFLLIPVLSLLLGEASAQIPIPFLDSCFFYPRVNTFDDLELINWQWDMAPPANDYLPYDYEGESWIEHHGPTVSRKYLFIEEYGSRVYGLAIHIDTNQLPATVGVGIYDKDLRLLASVNGDEPHYSKNTMYTFVTNPGRLERPVPCQLHLFNEPVVLPDTFFVAFFNTMGPMGPAGDAEIANKFRIYALHHEADYHLIIFLESILRWDISNSDWGTFFPIRELPCPVGPEPSLVAALSGQTVLGWQTGDTTLYLLDFYDEDGRLLFESDTLSQTSYVLSDSLLDAAGYHESGYLDVRLQRACSYMTSSYHSVVWSPWSAPRRFYHQRGAEGMAGVVMPELTASPNPATGMLRVEGEEGLLQMLDLEGREVLTRRLHERGTTLDVSALPRGVYLLRLVSDTGTVTRRVVLL